MHLDIYIQKNKFDNLRLKNILLFKKFFKYFEFNFIIW